MGEERGAEDLSAGLDLDAQPDHLLPGLRRVEWYASDDPAQTTGQRLQHRAKSLHLSSHASTSRKIYTEAIATSSNPTFFLSAGEASGDHYGAQIVAELLRRHPGANFFGLGGREMEAAGQQRVVRAEDVAHMGITEVLRHAPRVYGSYKKLVASIKERRPQAAVLIDFPDVNLRLARELKALKVPVVYFVSPQLWAWKRRRLRWVQERVDRMMVIFPFEELFYRNRSVDATFTGHPLAELPLPDISREEYALRQGLDPTRQWIALLPGSRSREVSLNLPAMLEAATILGVEYEYLVPVASTLDATWLKQQAAGGHGGRIHLVSDAREALHYARASVVASGTATVQAAVIGNPFVVVYKVSPLTFRLAKRLVHYPSEVWPSGAVDDYSNLPIAMVNLVAGRRVVPELIQDQFTAAGVASALRPFLDETPQRMQMMADLAGVRERLQVPPKAGSIAQVCDAVDSLLGDLAGRGRIAPANV
ncbi:MAG TPA: lipid-A-disaccharide synthase [Edaphobacter sp.]|nr:lipid-A-disaccharide synthase [Edaphobacter sp.]